MQSEGSGKHQCCCLLFCAYENPPLLCLKPESRPHGFYSTPVSSDLLCFTVGSWALGKGFPVRAAPSQVLQQDSGYLPASWPAQPTGLSAEVTFQRSTINSEVALVDLVGGPLAGLETEVITPHIQIPVQPDGHFNFRSLSSVGWRGASAPDPDLDMPRLFALVWVTS